MNTKSRDGVLKQRLEAAERHVAQGRGLMRKQCELIDELKRDGHDLTGAKDLLHSLEQTQMMHIADRDRIREELMHGRSDVLQQSQYSFGRA